MIAIVLFVGSLLVLGGALVAALIYGIGQWQTTSGKITAVAAGSLLAALVAFVVVLILFIIALPAIIALP